MFRPIHIYSYTKPWARMLQLEISTPKTSVPISCYIKITIFLLQSSLFSTLKLFYQFLFQFPHQSQHQNFILTPISSSSSYAHMLGARQYHSRHTSHCMTVWDVIKLLLWVLVFDDVLLGIRESYIIVQESPDSWLG